MRPLLMTLLIPIPHARAPAPITHCTWCLWWQTHSYPIPLIMYSTCTLDYGQHSYPQLRAALAERIGDEAEEATELI